MKRKQKLLMILGLLLLTALLYAYLATPVQQQAGNKLNQTPTRSPVPTDMAQSVEQKLLLERLQRKGAISAKVKRDLFNFYVKPVVVQKPVAPPRPVAPPPPEVKPQPVVQPVPQPTATSIKYLGMLQKEEQQVFFLGLDEDVAVARIGQQFGEQDQFTLKSFDGEILVVGQGPGRPEMMIKVADPVIRSGQAAGMGRVSQPMQVPQRPDNALKLQSFKIRDPSAIGRSHWPVMGSDAKEK